MRNTRLNLLVALMGMSAFMAGSTMADAAAGWTVMVYLDGDNNLEDDALNDFLEMASVGSSAEVNYVAELDRIPGYSDRYGNWTDARRGLIRLNDEPDASWGESVGEANMGASETLSAFVTWAMETYPAQRYALILWNHGGGWEKDATPNPLKGVCWDDTSDGDFLRTREVRTAIETALAGSREATLTPATLDMIGFDACLMGMVEVAYELQHVGTVMVASEQTEPVAGWPYDLIGQDLAQNPAMDAETFGTAIVNRHYESYDGGETLAAVRLSDVDALAATISALATALSVHSTDNPDACLTAAANVQSAIESCVINDRHGEEYEGSHGVSIYFPDPSAGVDDAYTEENILFAGATTWPQFLTAYSGMSGSWVSDAAAHTLRFEEWAYIDLYDFCSELAANRPDPMILDPRSDFVISGAPGGPYTHDQALYTLTNTGASALAYQVTCNKSWVDVSLLQGSLEPGAVVSLNVSLNAHTDELAEGTYSAQITVTNTTTGVSRSFNVQLFLEEPFSCFGLMGRTMPGTPPRGDLLLVAACCILLACAGRRRQRAAVALDVSFRSR